MVMKMWHKLNYYKCHNKNKLSKSADFTTSTIFKASKAGPMIIGWRVREPSHAT